MSAIKGRSVTVSRAGVAIAGVRTKSISINGAPIDISSDDDAGVRKLLEEPGQLDVNISVSGIVRNDTLRQAAMSLTDRVAAMTFAFTGFEGSPANTHGFSGDFYIASYAETGEYQGAVTFEAEFQSAGAVTLTNE